MLDTVILGKKKKLSEESVITSVTEHSLQENKICHKLSSNMRSNCSELNVLSKHPGSLQRTVFSRCRFSTQTLSTSSQMVRNSFSFMRKELSISGGATLSRFIRLVEKEGMGYQSLPSVESLKN